MILSAMMDRAARAPLGTMADIVGPGGLVVLAPHPDDESLGCGALLREAAAAGRGVAVVVVTDGCRSHRASTRIGPARLAAIRAREVREAVARLHPAIRLVRLGYPDWGTPTDPSGIAAAIARIGAVIADVAASALVATWRGDPHSDHVATAALAREVAATRPGLRLWSYPIWGRFTDRPGPGPDAAGAAILRLDPGPHRAAKAAAIASHRSQMTRLISDDPDGFVMPQGVQAHFIREPEVYLAD